VSVGTQPMLPIARMKSRRVANGRKSVLDTRDMGQFQSK
jgi:hypothetical protein